MFERPRLHRFTHRPARHRSAAGIYLPLLRFTSGYPAGPERPDHWQHSVVSSGAGRSWRGCVFRIERVSFDIALCTLRAALGAPAGSGSIFQKRLFAGVPGLLRPVLHHPGGWRLVRYLAAGIRQALETGSLNRSITL